METQLQEHQSQLESQGLHGAHERYDMADIEVEAWQLIANREILPPVEVKAQERRDNARTAIMEALTASGHLSRIELTGPLEEINTQVKIRLVNGWDDSLPFHEKQRRFAELCNELVIQRTHKSIIYGELTPDTAVLEISDWPEALAGTKIGYRDSNKKGMVRSTHLRDNQDGTYTRIIEQVSRSNSTWHSTYEFMLAHEISLPQDESEPDLVALRTPIIYGHEEYADAVVGVMRRLDEFAGPNVRYGDEKSRSNHVPYEELRDESARRESEVSMYVDDLAKLEEQLEDFRTKGMTQAEQDIIYREEVDRILTAICTLEPNYAEDTYGKPVAKYFYQAAEMVSRGETVQAQQLLASTNHLKEEVTFCGVTMSVEQAKARGMEVNSYGDLVEKGKESWTWKQGYCRVKNCPSKPRKTEVGPCEVCRKCQAEFDNGKDPTKVKVPTKKIKHSDLKSPKIEPWTAKTKSTWN